MPFPDWFGSGQNEAAFLRRVLDHVSDCLVAVDTEGRVVLINAPYCRLLGGAPDDFIGHHITEVVSPKTRLHLVARGDAMALVAPLEVRGHQLLARQVPVYQDDQIIGAVGLALFSNMAALKRAVAEAGQDRAIHHSATPWVARHGLHDIVGQGRRMDALRSSIERAASLHVPVLVHGETGCGKELVANAVHALSPRAKGPFVWLNCASIPESLIDAELFGYEGGAFTGAKSRGKPGKFELASGGTLFLDEIGDMPLSLQASLLRAVQNQEIVRVGGMSPIQIDTRIVCATHRNLLQRVKEGLFRSDLYYRLDVISLRVPALRERDDLDFLVDRLLERIAAREGLPVRNVPPALRSAFRSFDWPGNVRQLESALMRFLVEGDPGLAQTDVPGQGNSRGHDELEPLKEHLEREKTAYIRRAVADANGNKDEAARRLGISRATLYRELGRG